MPEKRLKTPLSVITEYPWLAPMMGIVGMVIAFQATVDARQDSDTAIRFQRQEKVDEQVLAKLERMSELLERTAVKLEMIDDRGTRFSQENGK